jgi:hypothetical protein
LDPGTTIDLMGKSWCGENMGETCENDWNMMGQWRFLAGNVIYKLEMFHDFPSGPFQESSKQPEMSL